MTKATDKQCDYIISLANQLTGERHSYLSQHRNIIGLSSSKIQRGISRAEASAIIDDLKAKLDAR